MEVREEGLLDAYTEVENTLGDPIFKEDNNARLHSAKDTMKWFEDIEVIKWSADSRCIDIDSSI